VYDPILARFLSPDPYVQMPETPGGFNRYAYCLNNPLIYTDPSGEFIFTVLAAIFAPPLLPLAIAADIGGTTNLLSNANNIDNFSQGLAYYGIGAAAGAISAGVGAGVNTVLAGGSFWAGVMGTSTVVSTGFASGFVSGAAGGFAGGFASGFGNAAMDPSNKFNDMMLKGLDLGWKGAIGGSVLGGIAGGIDAVKNNRNFWTGADKQYGVFYLKNNGEWAFEPAKNVINNDIKMTEVDKSIGIIKERSVYSTDLNRVMNSDGSLNLPKTAGRIGHALDLSNVQPGDYTSFWGYRWNHQPITKINHLFHHRSVTGWKDFFIFW